MYSILMLMLLGIFYYASRIRFVEDINSFMPKTEDSKYIGEVFKNIKIKDKIVILVSAKDTLKQTDPDEMILAGDQFLESLNSSPTGKTHIKHMMSKVDADFIDNMYNYTIDNLPIFLDSTDYIRLDSLLIRENLEKRMAQNYQNLLSPLSVVSKKFVLADPLGLAGNSLKNFNDLQLNLQYSIYNDHIFSADNKYLLAFISPVYGAGEISNNEHFVNEIEKQIQVFSEKYPDLKIAYFGGIPISVYNARQIKSDSILTMIITLSVITFVILLAFRRKSAIPLIILPVIFGGVFSLAVMYLIQGSISTIAVGAGSAILGVALSYSIHVFCHSLHSRSSEQIIQELSYPMTIGSFTTIGAFAGLTFSSSDILHDFGLFSCFTLIGTTLFCLVFLPHFLVFKPAKENLLMHWIEKATSYPFEKNKYLVGFICLITFVCFFFFNDVKFNSDMMKLNLMPKQFAEAEEIITKTFQGEYKTVYFVSVGDDMDEALKNYRIADKKLEELKLDGLINEFSSANKLLIPQEKQKARIALWNAYWTPEKKELLKKQLKEAGNKYKFKETAFDGFTSLLDKHFGPIDYNDDPVGNETNLLSEWIDHSKNLTMAISQVRLSEENKEKVYAAFNDSSNMVILDKPYFANKLAGTVNNDFNTILYFVSILVFISIFISYGRLEITLITFLPMAVSWIIILGLMAIFGIEFNIINIIISSFIFGIGDDFSIFITDGLLSEYKNGKKALNSHKTAIFFSAFTIIVGLGAMIFSKHPALYSISVTSIIGMISVVLVSYTLQPFIFRLLISGRTAAHKFPYTWYSLLTTGLSLGIFALGSILLTILSYLLIIIPLKKKHKQAFYHNAIYRFARFLLRVMANEKKSAENPFGERFEKPAIIIANHQSVIDIIQMLAIHNKIVMLTKSWVSNSPLFGQITRYANFVDVTDGYEHAADLVSKKMEEGYSIVVFPEGSRSEDCVIRRFHKGAFLLAERLRADIVPVLLHGQGMALEKNDPFYLKDSILATKILKRITFEESSKFGDTYQEKSKNISRMFREEHSRFVSEIDIDKNPYFRYKLIKNYTYKGPVLEWYLRVKIAMEKNYILFEELVPRNAKITDIGCGYGFLAYMLAFRSEKRSIIGIDYDEEKIEVANHNFSKTQQLKFIAADASAFNMESSDVFILNDVLHYLPEEKQAKLMKQCAGKLNPKGKIIIRDGDRDKNEKHRLTKLSELFSTKIIRFNKKEHNLKFISTEEIMIFAKANNFHVTVLDNDKYSSNTIYILE